MEKTNQPKKIIAIESFGVRISLGSTQQEIVEAIDSKFNDIIPENLYKRISSSKCEHVFSIRENKKHKFVLFKGRKKVTEGNDKPSFIKYLEYQIRLTVAEFAESRVFIHSGVIGWNGKAILIPGRSFQGKTTLVREFVKLGAQYYSDEYAVLDENGLVHPFPKTLSVRGEINEYYQVEYPVESFGGVKGIEPLAVGLILITEYEKNARPKFRELTDGEGIMELLSHTIPIRYNPKFALKVLNKTVNRAIIVKTKRGEAESFAIRMLSFFENKVF